MVKTINGNGPPTTKTRAQVGDFYVDRDSQEVYKCTGVVPGASLDYGFIDIHQAHDNVYEWKSAEGYKIKDASCFCYSGYRIDELCEIDFSEATSFRNMFIDQTSLTDIPAQKINTCSGESFYGMFYNCKKLRAIPELDTSNGTNFNNMFYGCSQLTSVPELDTGNGTDFGNMFSTCSQLTSVPELDTSNGTNFGNMFYGCSQLTSVPELDTSNGTAFNNMFSTCSQLTSVPELDTSNGTTFNNMFYGCSQLTSVPELDTSNGTNFYYMFNGCRAIESIPKLDVSSATNVNNMFTSCVTLQNLRLYNVRKSIQISSGTSWGHLLTVDSLVHAIKELCTVTTQQTLTMGSANLEKIADLYCKVTDDTTEKIEMELCESTDEGSMPLADYAALKKWIFK